MATPAMGVHDFDARKAIGEIYGGKLDPKQLTPKQRRECVAILHFEQGVTNSNIARLLKVNPCTVWRDLTKIQVEAGKALRRGHVLERELGRLLRRNLALYSLAVRKHDLSTAARITDGFIDKLMDLGIIQRAPRKIEGKLSLLELLEAVDQEDGEQYPIPSKANGKSNGAGLAEVQGD